MKLYRTRNGHYIVDQDAFYRVEEDSWDALITREDLPEYCRSVVESGRKVETFAETSVLAPIESQEVWASGVTYYRSRSARIEESKDAGGGDFYDRVYSAPRPELFFKATGRRVVGPNDKVRIRSDAKWSVPEPELTLLISPKGRITGYTIGNAWTLHLRQPQPVTGGDKHRDCNRARGRDRLLRLHCADRTEARSPDAGQLPLPRQQLSPRQLPDDRHRHRPSGLLHPRKRRPDQHHHRAHRGVNQRSCLTVAPARKLAGNTAPLRY
jgi:2-keto-4-pentenoate hydratase/2-oxohepta-3-ene-1,7-dioic acid hydratase in catechol pathway